MSLPIIIDKSTFQSLSFDEILRLSYYYKHNITPVLVMEILGDLKKEAKEGKPPPQQRVIDFATKLFPTNTIVNLHYSKLKMGELSGDPLPMDGRPTVGIHKVVQTPDGKKGWVAEESAEERAIYNWRDGHFTEADHELSKLWRSSTTREDLLINLQKELKKNGAPVAAADLAALDQLVSRSIDNPESQFELLVEIVRSSGISPVQGVQTIDDWHRAEKRLLKQFIPYNYHCLRVDMLFYLGLQTGLVGTQATNKVDLEYLYYLPFCAIFTSNDHLHKDLAPLLINKNQRFILGTDLKQDLKSINAHLLALPEEERKSYKDRPPLIEDSLTFQLWQHYYSYPNNRSWNKAPSEAEKQMAIAKMKEFEKANKGEGVDFEKGEDGSFFTRMSYLSKTDPCFCGSGKKIIDCCIPEDEFERIAKQQANEKQ
jgi:hypothetical protein